MHRTTISIDDDVHNFIEANNLSCSHILRVHIRELMNYDKAKDHQIKELGNLVQDRTHKLGMMRNFIEQEKLGAKFNEWLQGETKK